MVRYINTHSHSDPKLLPAVAPRQALILCRKHKPNNLHVLHTGLLYRLSGVLHRLASVLLWALQLHDRNLHPTLWRLLLYEIGIYNTVCTGNYTSAST